MDASRVHGFFEGMAVAVSLVAVGFVVLKEAEAFHKRNGGQKLRHGVQQFLTVGGNISGLRPNNLPGPSFISRNNHARSEQTELESRVADMLGLAIIDAHTHSEDNHGDSWSAHDVPLG